MSVFILKIIAVISMAVDHMGYVLFNNLEWMRIVGRLAFPIYAFLIANGFRKTRSTTKYLINLGLFALISEIPADLAFYGKTFYFGYQNIYFTLFIGLAVLMLAKTTKKLIFKGELLQKTAASQMAFALCALPWLAVGMYVAEKLNCDYGWCGVLAITLFGLAGEDKALSTLACTVNAIAVGARFGALNYFAIFAAIPISMYDGSYGIAPSIEKHKYAKAAVKYSFYAFYPLHLIVLWLIKII